MYDPKEPGDPHEDGPHSGVMVGMAGLQRPGEVQVWTLAFREGRGSGLRQGLVGFEA